MPVRPAALTLAVMLMLAASGCGLAYNANRNRMLQSASDTDFGPPPPSNHEELEAKLLRALLRDPESARFEYVSVAHDAIQSSFTSTTPMLVWISLVRVNAKNGFGGYTGFQPYPVVWRDGQIIAYGVNCENPCMWKYLKQVK